MRHQRVEEWEAKLDELLKKVDQTLEKEFGALFPPHPARPHQGSTANPQQDGLFRVTASFTPGFGSQHGKGYLIQIGTVTLAPVSPKRRAFIEQRALALLQEGVEEVLPGRGLTIKRDGHTWKLVGDLSLADKRT